jgi:ribosome-binding protein aMBF1 (putative translation factor)
MFGASQSPREPSPEPKRSGALSTAQTAAYQRFLRQLRKARADAGLTQRDVAKAFGKAPSFVANCESGERRVDVIELTQFARLYRKPLSFFVD